MTETFFQSIPIEELIPKLKDGSWREDYYDCWTHSDQSVLVSVDGDDSSGVVDSLNLDGFLCVRLESGQLRSFDTDNNSFDLMSGLISQK